MSKQQDAEAYADRLPFSDMVKFINAIRSQQLLWDKRMPEYQSDKGRREECWDKVGQEMFDDWDEVKPKIKNSRLARMKQKWRHLRDYYGRRNRLAVRDPKKRPKKDYCYSDSLSFLSEVMVLPPRNSEIEEPTEIDIEESEDDVEIEIISRPIREAKSAGGIKSKKRSSEPAGDTETPEVSRKHPKLAEDPTTTEEVDGDADRLFLLSMANDLKILTESEKLDFKIMCLQFFKNVRQRRDLVNNATPLINLGRNSQYVSHSNLSSDTSNFNHSNNFPVTSNLHHQQSFAGSSSSSLMRNSHDGGERAGGVQELRVENVFSMIE